MVLNWWSKLRSGRGTTSAKAIPKVQDVQDSLNITGVGTLSRATRHHHPLNGYSQATVQVRSTESTVEHQFRGINLVKTQLQLKIGLELIFKDSGRGEFKIAPPREDGSYVMQLRHS